MQGLLLLAVAAAGLGAAAPALAEARVPALKEQESTEKPAKQAVWIVPTLHTLGLFTTMRATEAVIWPDPFSFARISSWPKGYEESLTRPPLFDLSQRPFEWDGDRWTINVLGHGLLGSELYYRPRRCGASALGAVAFAASASAIWEYAFEGNSVRPSGLDLIFTPLSGVLIGEARYLGWTAAGQIADPTWRGVVRVILDPLGELQRTVGTPC